MGEENDDGEIEYSRKYWPMLFVKSLSVQIVNRIEFLFMFQILISQFFKK